MTPRYQFLAARLSFVVIILFATMSDLQLSPDRAAAAERLARAFTLSLSWADAIDGLRNLALFAGMGVIWMVTSQASRVRTEIWTATLTGFAISVAVESTQVFSPIRTASIIDVTTNTVGAFLGAAFAGMALSAIHGAKGNKSYVGIPMIVLAGPYLGAVLCEALAPLFQSEPDPQIDGAPYARLLTALKLALPLHWSEIPRWDIPIFLSGGILLVAAYRERGGRSAIGLWALTFAGGTLIAGAHVAHSVFRLVVRWEAAVTDVLSFAAGALIATIWLPVFTQRYRGPARARATILGYVALLIVFGWRPFLPETHRAAIVAQFVIEAIIPLASLSVRFDVFSALHVAQLFFLYLPLGALLAVWPVRREGSLSGLWPAIWLTVVIELGHFVIAGRLFDLTNAMISCAGLALGWLAIRRSGYRVYGESLA